MIETKVAFIGSCPDPTPSNGIIEYQSESSNNGTFPQGSSVRVACKSGYTDDNGASGLDSSSCNNGKWYPPLMKCIPNDEGE